MCLSYEQSNKTVTANGVEFHYSLDVDVFKPLLALVNMASVNLTAWEPVLAELLKFYRILRFDIRGTGKSAWGTDDKFTFSQYADDLAVIMDLLHIPKAFMLGAAYGARTAVQFALRYEQKLTGLALFDVALTAPVEQTEQKILAAQARQMLEEAGEPILEPKKYWRFYENRDAAFKAHTAHQHEPDTSEMLGHLKVPVLVACGRQDMNLGEAQRIANEIPGGYFEVMEMTGHGSPFFRPALFANLVNDFKNKLIC
jgi:pimeloyl-ACP methyl ester carboxylesterase